jgi:Domain of unknown function (DUF4388)
MPVSGYLSNFSLPEVLQFLQEGQKTGLLTVRSLPNTTQNFSRYFIWLNQGRIIAAADRTDYRGLVNMIALRKWLPEAELSRLVQQCPLQTPFGLHLKSQNLLSAEQMKLLFSVQIIRQICSLFELVDGSFKFMSNVQLPYLEMTGISIPATDITLPGLRSLRDWSALDTKLPLSTSSLLSTVKGDLSVKLNEKELQIWRLADGTVPIAQMVQQLDISLESARRTAFCLTVAGLAEEVPMMIPAPKRTISPNPEVLTTAEAPAISTPSQAFLDRVRGFLQQKALQKSKQPVSITR